MEIIEIRDRVMLVQFNAGEKLRVVTYVHPDISKFVKSSKIENGFEHITFETDIYLILKSFSARKMTADAIFFSREVIPGLRPMITKATRDAKGQAALKHQEIEPIISLPMFDTVITYPKKNEVAIANFKKTGNSGWILPKSEFEEYKELLPPITDSGVEGKFWLIYYNNNERISFEWEHEPAKTENITEITEITFDKGSFIVKSIRTLVEPDTYSFAIYQTGPYRMFNVSKRLHPSFRHKAK